MTASARAGCSPIGLDLGSRAIKAAQVVRSRRGVRLNAALTLRRLDPGPTLSVRDAERLGPAIMRAGFCGRNLAAALPAELAVHANIDLPAPGSKAPIDQIAASELARVSRAPAADLICAHWPAGSSAPGALCSSRVIGAERARIDALLDSLEQVHTATGALVPLALDSGPLALIRCIEPWLGDLGGEDVTIIADIGWRCCALTIVYGRRIIYERIVPGVGAEPVREAISHDLGAPPEVSQRLLQRLEEGSAPDAARQVALSAIRRQAGLLAVEVERSLRFAAEQGARGEYRLVLVGGGASAAITDAAAAALDGLAEVRRALPQDLIANPPASAAKNPALLCAIGLAMRMDR